jgi:Sec-independent protein translocase protein TatA
MIRPIANRTNGDFMTASAEEDVLVTVSETLGSAAGKVVAGAKRTAQSLGDEKEQLVRVATKVRSKARRAIKKTQSKAKKVTKSAKKAAASAKRSVKRVARKLKRR